MRKLELEANTLLGIQMGPLCISFWTTTLEPFHKQAMLGISVCHFMSLCPISYSSHWCGSQFHAREIWQHLAFCPQASMMLLPTMKHVAFLLVQPGKVGLDLMLTLTMNLCLLLPMGRIEIHFIRVLRRPHWIKHLLQAFWVAFPPLCHYVSHSCSLGSPSPAKK